MDPILCLFLGITISGPRGKNKKNEKLEMRKTRGKTTCVYCTILVIISIQISERSFLEQSELPEVLGPPVVPGGARGSLCVSACTDMKKANQSHPTFERTCPISLSRLLLYPVASHPQQESLPQEKVHGLECVLACVCRVVSWRIF